MSHEIDYLQEEAQTLNQLRDMYSQRYMLVSRQLDPGERARVNKLFRSVDRLRNHIRHWLRDARTSTPQQAASYIILLKRGSGEVRERYKLLEASLYKQ